MASGAGHYARYNATAPLEASSGPRVRHRLNPHGNRQLNHALHVAAITQISHDTIGRAYFLRKIAEARPAREALRALKRHISDASTTNSSPAPCAKEGPGGQLVDRGFART